jgi:hypothetical protein
MHKELLHNLSRDLLVISGLDLDANSEILTQQALLSHGCVILTRKHMLCGLEMGRVKVS